jgi:anthranilate phosphoribosyltransferase
MAAIFTAAAGMAVIKHGGRPVPSRSGSADVLEELGISLDLPQAGSHGASPDLGIGFNFAPSTTSGSATPPWCAARPASPP